MINELKFLASEYAKTTDGSWLNEIDWINVPVTFKNLKGDIMGYHFFGRVVLREVCNIDLIFDIYIHELRHVWQSKTNPIKYLIGKIFRFIIENDADKEEKKALNWFYENEKRLLKNNF